MMAWLQAGEKKLAQRNQQTARGQYDNACAVYLKKGGGYQVL